MPAVHPMTDNGKGQYRLEDVLADASNGERRQILRYMGVKAVNGTKLHYKQTVPAKTAVNEDVENESDDELAKAPIYRKKQHYRPTL